MFSFTREIDFNGYTFIVPSVSVGNVPQLAVDVIVENLKLESIGQVWHPALIPIVGPAAFEHEPTGSITTAAELYASEEKKLLVLQIRAPLVGSLQRAFFDQLADFVRDSKLARAFILSSSFSHEKFDIRTGPFRYVANEHYSKTTDATRLEDERWTKHTAGVIHGGGFTLKLLEALTARSVATLVFFMYVSEGDNTVEGLVLARMLHAISGDQLLPVFADPADIRRPKSWKHLFGTEHPRALY